MDINLWPLVRVILAFIVIVGVVGSLIFYRAGFKWTAIVWFSFALNLSFFFFNMGSLEYGTQVFMLVLWPLFTLILASIGIIRYVRECRARKRASH